MEEEAEKLKQMQTEVNNEMTSPVGSALMKEKTKPLMPAVHQYGTLFEDD